MENTKKYWQTVLERTNKEFEGFCQIEITENEDGFFDMVVKFNDGKTSDFASNYFEEELIDLIADAQRYCNSKKRITTQMSVKDKPETFTTVEDLCKAVGCDINKQELAQMKIESILNYLVDQGVINEYNVARLDGIFSNEQNN